MEILTLLVQLALAGAAIWYTIETRKLRLQSEQQMGLLKNQTRLSVAPFLVPGLIDVNLAVLRDNVQQRTDLSDEQKTEALANISRSYVKYVCTVNNPTTKVPHHINLYIYDSSTKSFLSADYSKEWIAEKDNELFQVSEPCYSRDDVLKRIKDQYGNGLDFIDKHLVVGDISYIALLFRDLEGRVYLTKRVFAIARGNSIHHDSSAMYFQS